MHDSAWSKDLTVEVGGHGVVSHAGSAVLRMLADATGLTGALSAALSRPGSPLTTGAGCCVMWRWHRRRRRLLSDAAVLRDQPELFGPVASIPTMWRSVERDRRSGAGADHGGPGADPGTGVGADRGPARADPALAGRRRRSRWRS